MPSRLLWGWCVVALAMSGVCLPTVRGDNFNWIGLGNTPNWDDHSGLYGNWGTIALPTATSDVEFGQFFNSGNPNLHGTRIVNSVDLETGGSFTLTGGTGDTLTLASGNLTQQSFAAASGTHQLNVPVAIQADGIWNIAGGGLTVSGGVTSLFGGSDHMLAKTGAGPLTLGGGTSDLSLLDVKAGSFIMNGGVLNMEAASGDAIVGDGSASAAALFENGAALGMYGQVRTDISGTMTFTNANTMWQATGTVYVGSNAPGQLSISDTAAASLNSIDIGNGNVNVQSGG